MKNLLLTTASHAMLKDFLSPFSEQVHVIELQDDGTLHLNDHVVTTQQYPIHATWLSPDLIGSKTVRHFTQQVTSATELQWMQTITAGLDAPFFKQVFDQGTRLTNSDAQAPAIAEYVVASVLTHYQKFTERAALQAQAKWQATHFREIYGSRWLIVGFGNIGQRVGEIAKSFHADVTGVKRSVSDMPHCDRIITYADMNSHLPQADVVVLACALTDDTRELFNAENLALMKSDAVLVNIARGGVVDEPALIAALDQGQIDHAVLDVFAKEPLPENSPLWQHPRVTLTPHSSNRGAGTTGRGQLLFQENLTAYLAGKPLRNAVDKSFF
ncbi:MAG: phosphoglycerate dehydrogenase-like enzyme [Candidatus Azotimanducaceae bacterium]|jgi:phosphoglycerate dehydrogenase-like enzyme